MPIFHTKCSISLGNLWESYALQAQKYTALICIEYYEKWECNFTAPHRLDSLYSMLSCVTQFSCRPRLQFSFSEKRINITALNIYIYIYIYSSAIAARCYLSLSLSLLVALQHWMSRMLTNEHSSNKPFCEWRIARQLFQPFPVMSGCHFLCYAQFRRLHTIFYCHIHFRSE